MIILEGFEQAYIGAGYRCGQMPVAIYNYEVMCAILVNRDGMTPDEAVEFIEYNILHAWVGENTPLILIDDIDTVVNSVDDEPEQTER